MKRQSLSDAVFEQLRDEIVAGKIEPGVELPAERALSERLGVNRGALREGLKRLEQARLISIQHGGATRVLNFRETASMDLLSQLLLTTGGKLDVEIARSVVEMRTALAPDVARLAAERGGPATAARVEELVQSMTAAGGELRVLQPIALEFWRALVEGSGNVAYRLAFNTMHQVYSQLQDLLTETLGDELRALSSYRAVARAVRAREPAKAEKKARELARLGGERLLEVLHAIEALDDKPTPASPRSAQP